MKALDLKSLSSALLMTLNPNQQTIQQGEQMLNIAQKQENYGGSLMMITDDASSQLALRQAAVIGLKTYIEKYWKITPQDPYVVPEHEKAIIRGTIIDALIRCVNEKKLRSQYEDIFYRLCALDYPADWPGLLVNLVANLQSINSYEVTFGTISCLRRLVSNFQFHLDNDRKPLEVIVNQTFPLLEIIAQKCLENYVEQTGQIMRVILKTFYHAMFLELPFHLTNLNNFQKWMTYCKMILSSQLQDTITFDEMEITSREKNYMWANKKQAGRIMVRVIQKYCNPKMIKPEIKVVHERIVSAYSSSFMETFYQILISSDTQFQTPKTCLYAIKYLCFAMKIDFTQKLLVPYLDKVLFDIALPKMQLTTKDDRIWKEDPEEYIRRQDDQNATYNFKNAAKDLFEEVCKKKDLQGVSYLIHFLNYCQQCFTSQVDPRSNKPLDLLKREALLWGIESQSEEILKIENAEAQVEMIIENFVLPELKSNIGFLRARACLVLDKFGAIDFKNRNNIPIAVTVQSYNNIIFKAIYNCILDAELPVKVAAATSLATILAHPEAKQLIQPGLNSILEIYIKLMERIDNQGIVSSLQEIVTNFETEISPFAEQLTKHLVTIFFKYCNKQTQNDDSDEDNSTELAAASCLEAISRIINAPLSDYSALESIILPIFNYAFCEIGNDFVPEALEILNMLLFKNKNQISQSLWLYYPLLAYSIIGLPPVNLRTLNLNEEIYTLFEQCKNPWGQEYLKSMIGCFRNFIKKGGDVFFTQNDMFGNSLVALAFQLIEKVYANSINLSDDTDTCSITVIFISMIENHIGRIDHLIPQILNLCIRNIQQGQTSRFRVVNFGVLGVLFWYNAQLTLSLLNQLGVTDYIMECFFTLDNQIKHQWDLQRYFLGVLTILKLPDQMIPAFIQANAQKLGKILINLTSLSLKLQTEDESCELEEQAIEDQNGNFVKGTGDSFEESDDEDDESFDNNDDFDNANLYEGPNDTIDEVLLLENVLMELQQSNPQLHIQLTGYVSEEERLLLLQNITNAKENYLLWTQKLKESQ